LAKFPAIGAILLAVPAANFTGFGAAVRHFAELNGGSPTGPPPP